MSDTTVPTWKKVVAAILDFLTVFIGGGLIIANITGETVEGGFNLEGTSALVLMAIVVAYFVLLPRVGGTLWQRILGTKK